MTKSKYNPLRAYLEAVPAGLADVTLTFGHIESIVGFRLPASARKYRAWWSNSSTPGDHSQAQAWLGAGWRVDTVDQRHQWVRFWRSD